MIGLIRVVAALSCVMLATLLLTPIQLLAMKTGWLPENLARGLWHRINVKALGFRVHVSGRLSDKRPLLIASNHVSWTDIEIMASLFDLSFVAKSELAGWPLIGSLSRLQRPIYVERDRRGRSGEQAGELARRLAAKETMVLFAEGSTGDGNMVLPFKSTLFAAAAKAIEQGACERVYIQPVAIAYTRIHGVPMGRQHRVLGAWIGGQELVPHMLQLLREGAIDVELRFGGPIEFAAGTSRKHAAAEIQRRVHKMMQDALRNPRPSH